MALYHRRFSDASFLASTDDRIFVINAFPSNFQTERSTSHMTYDPVLYSRMLTELTFAFHIIFATVRVGIPDHDRFRRVVWN